MQIEPGYEQLADVLQAALDQAQRGKGKERHAQDLPFDSQPIMAIPRLLSSDAGLLYQAIKKLQESARMEPEACIKERLGAINYIAASILFQGGRGEGQQGGGEMKAQESKEGK